MCALDHLLILCPLLADIQKDPFCCKAIQHALGAAVPSTAPTGGFKQVCAVLDASLSDPGPAAALPDSASGDGASALDFLACPPAELHPSSSDGQTDVSRAVPGCVSKSGLCLPSATLPGHLPCPHVDLDFLSLHKLALDLVAVSYFEVSGGVDPASFDAPDTDDDCILDLGHPV